MTGSDEKPEGLAAGFRDTPIERAGRNEIADVVRRELAPRAEFALLFGSVNGPYFRDDSDVDVAALFLEPAPDFAERAEIADRISLAARREIDLVSLNDADVIITMQALANGELILCRNESAFVKFKALAMSKYIDFKMSRKIIEDHLTNGRIYA